MDLVVLFQFHYDLILLSSSLIRLQISQSFQFHYDLILFSLTVDSDNNPVVQFQFHYDLILLL